MRETFVRALCLTISEQLEFVTFCNEAKPPIAAPPLRPKVPAMTGRTIMIVEDDSEIRSLLSDFLTREGFTTVCAEDGAAMDRALSAIAAQGDRDNRERVKLSKQLAVKAAQPRYEAFLERAPAFIASAARARQGEALRTALDAHEAARHLVSAARGLSLDAQGTVFEMAGIVARLAPRGF